MLFKTTQRIIPEAQTCIDITRKWLEDQSSVSVEELCDIANDAADAADYCDIANDDADAADYNANAAAYAAYAAANAANAAADASAASYAYAYAVVDVAEAADAAYAAVDAIENKLDEQNRQTTFILNFFGVE